MAKYISDEPKNGFTVSEITQGKGYPSEVDQFVNDPGVDDDPGITEEQAVNTLKAIVDTSEATKIGEGMGVVYVYGYRCCEDRLKIGSQRLRHPSAHCATNQYKHSRQAGAVY